MATKDTDPVVPPTQPRTSQGEAASGLGDASIYSRCPTCNDDPEAAPFCSNGCHAELADSLPNPSTVKGTGKLEAPYTTPIPTLHDGSTGWVYCDNCDLPQPVSGHDCEPMPRCGRCADLGGDPEQEGACGECGLPPPVDRVALAIRIGSNTIGMYRAATERAELAESLLCAMAFDHAAFLGARLFCVRSRRDPVTHGLGCAFCDAAHGGGR